jgi:hypothetical protein
MGKSHFGFPKLGTWRRQLGILRHFHYQILAAAVHRFL